MIDLPANIKWLVIIFIRKLISDLIAVNSDGADEPGRVAIRM
jgi:hypothetical protein